MSIFNIPTRPTTTPTRTQVHIERSTQKRYFMYQNRRTGLSTLEQDELDTTAKKVMRARFVADKIAEQQYQLEHQNGYCPHCFSLIRLNGKCDNCD